MLRISWSVLPVKHFQATLTYSIEALNVKKSFFLNIDRRRSKLLLGRVAGDESDIRVSRTDLHGNDYHVVAADLTDTAALEAKLTTDCGLVSVLQNFLFVTE